MKRTFCFSILLVLFAATCQAQQPPAQGAKPAVNTKKKLLDSDLQGFDLSDDKSGNVHTQVGGTRGGGNPPVTYLAPKSAKLYGPSALFQWESKIPSQGFILTIVDEDETRMARAQLKDPSYKLSTEIGKLQPGETYTWRVQVLPQTVAVEGSDFTMVTADERQKIEKELAAVPAGDPYESGFARARIFVKHH